MLSKQEIKLINSLKLKKYRKQKDLFFAEGNKIVKALLQSQVEVERIYHNHRWSAGDDLCCEKYVITENEMKKISQLKTPPDVIGIFKIPQIKENEQEMKSSLSILIDGVQDPGNLGAIVRLADWYGVKNVFCSTDTVDIFNPKVVQATMGAIASVRVYYTDLEKLIKKYQDKEFPIYGTFMKGENIYQASLKRRGFIILGNEGKGIRDNLGKLITQMIHIPSFNPCKVSESLNVSTAFAIVLSEFLRRVEIKA